MKKITGYISLTAIIAICVSLSFQSCKNGSSKTKDEKIDSLAILLKNCEMSMDQDQDELRRRIDRINSSINKLQRFGSDTFNHEFIRSLDQYEASQKIYKRFLEHAPEMYIELNALKTQLLSLKKSSDEGKISDEQFFKFYTDERTNVLKLHELCEEVAEPIDKIEPMYLRAAPRIEAFSDSLQKVSGN